MSNLFARFYTDRIKIVSQDGAYTSPELKANVAPGKIATYDINIDVNDGDYIDRFLPNGKTERYQVIEAHFKDKFEVIEAHYIFDVKKTTALPKVASQTTYNISGHNSRIYNNSVDHSSNTLNVNSESFFKELRQLVQEKVSDNANIVRLIGEMESTKGQDTFLSKYSAFIAAAANHMSLLSPFIPGLTAMIGV